MKQKNKRKFMQIINSNILKGGNEATPLISSSSPSQSPSLAIFIETQEIIKKTKNSSLDTHQLVLSCNKTEQEWLTYFQGTNIILNRSVQEIGLYLIHSWKEKNPEQALQLLQYVARIQNDSAEILLNLFVQLSDSTPKTSQNLKIRCEILRQFVQECEITDEATKAVLSNLLKQIDEDLQFIKKSKENYSNAEYIDLLQEFEKFEINKDYALEIISKNKKAYTQRLIEQAQDISQDLKLVDKIGTPEGREYLLNAICKRMTYTEFLEAPALEFVNYCIKYYTPSLFRECLVFLNKFESRQVDNLEIKLLNKISEMSFSTAASLNERLGLYVNETYTETLLASIISSKEKILKKVSTQKESQQNINLDPLLKAFVHVTKLCFNNLENSPTLNLCSEIFLAKINFQKNENAKNPLNAQDANIVWKSAFLAVCRQKSMFPDPNKIFDALWFKFLDSDKNRTNIDKGEFLLEIFKDLEKDDFYIEIVCKHLKTFIDYLPKNSKLPESTINYLKCAYEYISEPTSPKLKAMTSSLMKKIQNCVRSRSK